jgi:two-component system OmpR family response regulator
MMHILIIEDDEDAATYLNKGLSECGHTVDYANNGNKGLQMALAMSYDVLVVDRMLPDRDGLSVIAMLRAGGVQTPTLILSALGEVDDRVDGLQAGGDDYLVKPYAFTELLARLDALTRRTNTQTHESILMISNLTMNTRTHEVRRAGKKIHLQPMEFRLLKFFMSKPNQVFTRTMLLDQVWGYHFNPQTNVIDVHISRLRRKIETQSTKPLLHTVRGSGYKLSETP